MTEATEDPCECKVWCSTCNCYLYSVSIYDPISQGSTLALIKCPRTEQCKEEASAARAARTYFPPYH